MPYMEKVACVLEVSLINRCFYAKMQNNVELWICGFIWFAEKPGLGSQINVSANQRINIC